ncbi:hypothetical protein ZTR_08224 [Talaromyces verruculosus]|nr:hypothetical protein ZTR_08224 [Talaromyces verruculosus]
MQSKTLVTIIGLSATVLGHPAAGNVGPHPNAAGVVSYPIPHDFEPNQCYCCPTAASGGATGLLAPTEGLCGAVDFETKGTTCAAGDNLVCCDDGLCNSVRVNTGVAAGGLTGLVTSLLNLAVNL